MKAVIFFLLLSGATSELFVGICFDWALCDVKENKTIPGNVINPETIQENVAKITVWRNQAQVIQDLPELESIVLINLRLEAMPVLKNLPKLHHLHLTSNNLERIRGGDLSETGLSGIVLAGNEISSIDDGSFGLKVRHVDLSCNDLGSFRPGWFKNPQFLKTLRLNGNQLDSLPADSFRSFPELKHLDLSHNFLKTIRTGTFSGTRHFKRLILSFNALTELDSDAFPQGGVYVEMLDLRYNYLTTLPSTLWERTVVSDGLIDGNPWQCSLYRKLLVKWCNWKENELEDSKCKISTGTLTALDDSTRQSCDSYCSCVRNDFSSNPSHESSFSTVIESKCHEKTINCIEK